MCFSSFFFSSFFLFFFLFFFFFFVLFFLVFFFFVLWIVLFCFVIVCLLLLFFFLFCCFCFCFVFFLGGGGGRVVGRFSLYVSFINFHLISNRTFLMALQRSHSVVNISADRQMAWLEQARIDCFEEIIRQPWPDDNGR